MPATIQSHPVVHFFAPKRIVQLLILFPPRVIGKGGNHRNLMPLAGQVNGKIRVERADTGRLRVEVDSPHSNFHVALLVRNRGKFASLKNPQTTAARESTTRAPGFDRGLMLKQRVGAAFNSSLLSTNIFSVGSSSTHNSHTHCLG